MGFGHPVGEAVGFLFCYMLCPPVAKQLNMLLPKVFAKRKLATRGHISTGMKYGVTQGFSFLSSLVLR